MTVGVNQELAPIKFCFFIKQEMASFLRASQIANCLWGGKYSPIFPLIDKFDDAFRIIFQAYDDEEKYYKNIINNFNPDVIIFDDGVPIDLIDKISDGRAHISLTNIERKIPEMENEYGFTIWEVLYEIVTSDFKYKRNDNLHIHLVNNETNDPLASVIFNTPMKALSVEVQKSLEKNEFVKITNASLEVLQALRKNDCITYSRINSYGLHKVASDSDFIDYVFIFKSDDFNSLVILWNMIASGCRLFAWPISARIDGVLDQALLDFCARHKDKHFGPTVFVGPSLTREQVDENFKYIQKVVQSRYTIGLVPRSWIPRFAFNSQLVPKDGVISSVFVANVSYDQIKLDGHYLTYKFLRPKFKPAGSLGRKTHKVTSYIKYYDHLLNYPSVVDGIDNRDWGIMTDSTSYEEFRISKGGIIRLCQANTIDVSFKPPETSDYLKFLFARNGLRFSIQPQGNLTKQIFKNIEGVFGIHKFRSIGAIKVLHELEDENILSYENMVQQVKLHKPLHYENRVSDFIAVLLANNIMELGAQIQCTVCYQRSFYPLLEISESFVCKSCRSSFSPPLNDPKAIFKWHYRGIGPFSKNNKVDGLLTAFLTLFIFDSETSGADGITSFMNFQLEQQKTSLEVDLMVQLRSGRFSRDKTELIFCECKTYNSFTSKDIERMIFLGNKFPGAILLFSTLKAELTSEEIQLISSVVNYFRKGSSNRPLNPVLILTSNELLPPQFKGSFDHFGDIHPMVRRNDRLGYLCEASCEKYLNIKKWSDIKIEEWIAEQNRRNQISQLIYQLSERANRIYSG